MSRNRPDIKRIKRYLKLRAKGLSQNAAAKKMGVGNYTCYRWEKYIERGLKLD